MLRLLQQRHVPKCQLTSRLTSGALVGYVEKENYLSFGKRRV
jgi:hypothetical protein